MKRVAALLLAALAASCGGEPEQAPAAAEVRVFAAASLTNVMKEIAADYEKETGSKVKLNLAATSVLAKQIVEGAPCDVFLSADQEWADFVEKAGLVEPGTRRDLVGNSLVLVRGSEVLPPESTSHESPQSRIVNALRFSKGRIAIGDPAHVPAGRYAKTALQALGAWDDVESRIVPCESVRAALALVECGEVERAIVYHTDAVASTVRQSGGEFPPIDSVDIRYPALGVKGWSSRGAEFLRHLEGKSATRAFLRAGFRLPPWTR